MENTEQQTKKPVLKLKIRNPHLIILQEIRKKVLKAPPLKIKKKLKKGVNEIYKRRNIKNIYEKPDTYAGSVNKKIL